ncbi:class 5 chitinase 1 [Emericellopsis cladophorae]|uniref:Class 5 chitinase 1 n=1 Tax=Emericellopsis cladophorae TaxID=2686198 RepID=A0A9P9Y1X9_9HYPO|nr:class 5 chitinase 1 [Emericellopsis cladophorae]KAI6781590.1 class 5 chitinase 1 [Emericellopsis cladophorae]
MQCFPPHTFVLPPLVLESFTTISLPPMTEGVQKVWPVSTEDGNAVYTTITTTVVITVPALTTSIIHFSNIPWTQTDDNDDDNTVIWFYTSIEPHGTRGGTRPNARRIIPCIGFCSGGGGGGDPNDPDDPDDDDDNGCCCAGTDKSGPTSEEQCFCEPKDCDPSEDASSYLGVVANKGEGGCQDDCYGCQQYGCGDDCATCDVED